MKQILRKLLGACIASWMVITVITCAMPNAYAVDPTYTVSTAYQKSIYHQNLKALALTGNQRSDVVRVALTQLGYHEGNSEADFGGGNTAGSRNFVEYNRLHGKLDNNEGNGVSYGYYWCASFATWCAEQAAIPESIVTREVSTIRLRSSFINKSAYHARGTYTPIMGDYIFFRGEGTSVATNHVGLVLYVANDTVYTVEGNAGGDDCVALKEYALDDTYIVGYGVPRYTTGTATDIDLTNRQNPGQYIVTASSLALRSGAGVSYTALGAVPRSTMLTVTAVRDGWGQVSYGGQSGWISLSYALPLSMPTITVTYDANGGSGAPGTQGKTVGVPLTLSTLVPKRTGYTFLGWSTSPSATKPLYAAGGSYTLDQSVELYAVWQRNTYVISFLDYDGTLLQSRTYAHGDPVTPPADPSRAKDETYTYRFAGWNQTVTAAAATTTYVAQYEATYVEYNIVFCDEDGTVLAVQTHHYGDNISRTPIPEKPADKTYSYTFIGWGEVPSRVTGDQVYTAVYDKTYLNYLITFADEDGIILQQGMYHYGDTVTPPQPPVKASDDMYDYIFLGWDKTVSTVDGIALYTATYEKQTRRYAVTFLNADGTVIDEQACAYGESPTVPADPTMAADERYRYTFRGWSADIVPVTADATYTAAYDATPMQYTVTFRDDIGNVITTDTYRYGDTVAVPADPVKPSTAQLTYTFAGWDRPVSETVQGDAEYIARFESMPTVGTPPLLQAGQGMLPPMLWGIFACVGVVLLVTVVLCVRRRRR